jgi:hypothetical protein
MEELGGPAWRKSSCSGANGGQCIEVAKDDSHLLVCDTKNRTAVVLRFSPEAWRRFVSHLKADS